MTHIVKGNSEKTYNDNPLLEVYVKSNENTYINYLYDPISGKYFIENEDSIQEVAAE